MKFGKDLVTGLERHFTSWKSEDDPSYGEFTVWIDTKGSPQMILRDGRKIKFRAGPWNGIRFSGGLNLRSNLIYTFGFVLDQKEMYYHFDLINTSVVTRIFIKPSGSLERLLWIDSRQEWIVYSTPQTDNCDSYALCGSFGICDINNSPACGCLEGFEATSPAQRRVADWSRGCRRTSPLDCWSDEGFSKYSNLKLPDTQGSWFNQSMNLEECERVCKSNCSCTAYKYQNITGSGSGCLLWFGDLLDIRTYTEDGQDLYIRLSASELANSKSSSVSRVKIIVPIVLVILLAICLFYRFKSRKPKPEGTPEEDFGHDPSIENLKEDLELPLFGLTMLLKATNNFSTINKVGEGGFGPVYKGAGRWT